MKGVGWLLLGIGAAWLLYALNLDTSVQLPPRAGWPGRVQNLSLMEHRRIHLMLSGGVLIASVLLMGFGNLQRRTDDDDVGDDEDYRQCPLCAEQVRVEAVICRHCRSALPALDMDDVEPDEGEGLAAVNEDTDLPEQAYSYRALREAAEAAEREQ